MSLSLKPGHVKRYVEIARLLLQHGRSDLLDRSWLDELRAQDGPAKPVSGSKPEELADQLERMGPTFVKLGQVLSTRGDLLPMEYLEALTRLQDHVEPFAFADVEKIVEEELHVRLSKAFDEFDPRPLAAASLGQVHRAVLRGGRVVAVKVQRPDVREQVAADLEVLAELTSFLDHHTDAGRTYHFSEILRQFQEGLAHELDYRLEARNLEQLGTNLAEFDRITVPAPVHDYTTSRVLTMDYVRGRKVTAISPLARIEIDGHELADQLFRAYLKQVLVDGFFQADPHPGNVFVMDDGRLALIDLGMVSRIGPGLQQHLLKMLIAISEGRGETVADIAEEIGVKTNAFERERFRREVGALIVRQRDANVSEMEIGKLLLRVSRTSAQTGIRVPPELSLLGKALLNLDQVGRTLDPGFDPNEAVRRNAAELLSRKIGQAWSLPGTVAALGELRDLLEKLPSRAGRFLDLLANNELHVSVDAIDEDRLISGMQKIANRITLGLVLAALIVGAALLMRVETSWRLFGYPALAMACFLAAAGGAVALIVSILRTDDPVPKEHEDV